MIFRERDGSAITMLLHLAKVCMSICGGIATKHETIVPMFEQRQMGTISITHYGRMKDIQKDV